MQAFVEFFYGCFLCFSNKYLIKSMLENTQMLVFVNHSRIVCVAGTPLYIAVIRESSTTVLYIYSFDRAKLVEQKMMQV